MKLRVIASSMPMDLLKALGATPVSIAPITEIYRGVVPFIIINLIALVVIN